MSAPTIEQHESRRIRAAIRRVLLEVWDPIGVRDNPNAQDEYESYLGDIYEMLIAGCPDSALKLYLDNVAIERMGFSSSPEAITSSTIKALRAIPLA